MIDLDELDEIAAIVQRALNGPLHCPAAEELAIRRDAVDIETDISHTASDLCVQVSEIERALDEHKSLREIAASVLPSIESAGRSLDWLIIELRIAAKGAL